VSLGDELHDIAASASTFAAPDEEVAAVVAAEPSADRRTYLCAFDGAAGRSWLALDAEGSPITSRNDVRDAISIAAVCEIAEDSTGTPDTPRIASPGHLERLEEEGDPSFAIAIRDAMPAVDELAREVESQYKLPLT
jgi:hypothetical protein